MKNFLIYFFLTLFTINISYTQPEQKEVCNRIKSGTSDVEEQTDGSMYFESTDLEIGTDNNRGNQLIGLRFTNVLIPKGARIDEAYLQFTADETDDAPTSAVIYGQNFITDDVPPFNNTSNNLSDRIDFLHSESVSWNDIPAWTIGESGAAQKSPDIKTIVQDFISRTSWQKTDALMFMIEGTGQRVAESFNGSPEQAPQLCVKFTAAEDVCRIIAPRDGDEEYPWIDFNITSSLACTGGNPTGEAHITYEQYLADNWYTIEDFECNSDNEIIIIRGGSRLTSRQTTVSRGNSACFQETWTIDLYVMPSEENLDCPYETYSISIEVYVYTDENPVIDLVRNEDPILSDIYLANNTITSQGAVRATNTVTFIAGNTITLLPGFMTELGANFSAKIVAIDGCYPSPSTLQESTIAHRITTDLSIEKNSLPTSLSIHPNPFDTYATINYHLSKASEVAISIVTMNGQLVDIIQPEVYQNAGSHTISLSNQHYPKGVYFLQFQNNSERLVQKIVVQ